MSETPDIPTEYNTRAGGAYTPAEHLAGQQHQESAQYQGKLLHEPGAPGVLPLDDDGDSDEPESEAGSHAAHPDGEGTGEPDPVKLG